MTRTTTREPWRRSLTRTWTLSILAVAALLAVLGVMISRYELRIRWATGELEMRPSATVPSTGSDGVRSK
jgi:hypothetical protein